MVQEGSTRDGFIRAASGGAQGLICEGGLQWSHWRGEGVGLDLTIGHRKDVKEERRQTLRHGGREVKNQLQFLSCSLTESCLLSQSVALLTPEKTHTSV